MSSSEINCDLINTFSIEKVCQSSNFLKNLQAVIQSHPDETARNFGMSIIYLLDEEHDKALEYLESIAQKNPNISLIQLRIAEIFIYRNDYRTAITYLEKVLELDNEDLTAKFWLCLSYYMLGEAEKAKFSTKSLKESIFLLQMTKSNWI